MPAQSTHPEADRARPGQILIMCAAFLTVLIGALGLATDLGIAFAGRRTMQNAADAAAYAGARAIAKASITPGITALPEVQSMTSDNSFTFSSGAPVLETCRYVDDADVDVGGCGSTPPHSATGVKVTISESHPTYFIRVVPGAPNATTTRATAIAHVWKRTNIPSDGPFLVCGVNTRLESGGNLSVMVNVGGVWQINPVAMGQTFKIHGPQIEKCNAKSSRYKGVADQDVNTSKSAPPEQWFNYKEGDTAGPISFDVEGIQGCKAGQALDNCVAFLPIVVDTPPESGNNRELWTIGYAPFLMKITGANTHSGKLIGAYIVKGPASAGWIPGYYGPIVIKLTA